MRDDSQIYLKPPSLGDRLNVWIASGLGVGLVVPAPGTVGGLWGLALVPAVTAFDSWPAQLGLALALAVIAAPVCGSAARALGGDVDPGVIVLDEVVALPMALVGVSPLNWRTIAAGYLLFRICDIWKPGLAREAEKLPGGLGIVADDFLAAVLACFALHGLILLDNWSGVAWLTPAA